MNPKSTPLILKLFGLKESGEDRCADEQPGEANDARGGRVIEDEATQPKTRAPPVKPSREEVEKRMTAHLPFRDWRQRCVRGKSGSKPHNSNQSRHEIPTVAEGYMFMRSNQGEQEESGMQIMVTNDLLNCSTGIGVMSASALVQKGVC